VSLVLGIVVIGVTVLLLIRLDRRQITVNPPVQTPAV